MITTDNTKTRVATALSDFETSLPGIFPDPQTQPGRLLAALLTGEKIDPLKGWFRLGIYRIADSVIKLRRSGWPITTNNVEVRNRYGEPCVVAEYELPSDIIDEAGELGQLYAEFASLNSSAKRRGSQ